MDTALAGLVPEVLIDPDEEITLDSIRDQYNLDNPPRNGTLSSEEELEREQIVEEIYVNTIKQQDSVRERSKQVILTSIGNNSSFYTITFPLFHALTFCKVMMIKQDNPTTTFREERGEHIIDCIV